MTAFIYDAVRSPRGKARPDGGLASIKPQEIVGQLIDILNERTNAGAREAETLTLASVGQVGSQGGNIALVAKLHAGLPDAVSASTINNYCVGGLTAVGHAAASVLAGNSRLALGGGVEMMSQVGFMADKADYYTDDSLPSRARYIPVAVAADRVAERWSIDRAAMDEVALRSQELAIAAEGDAKYRKSRVAIRDRNGTILLDHDECIRPVTTEKLASMEPVFGKVIEAYAAVLGSEVVTPLHTVAHAPPMCDGAGLVLVGAEGALSAAPRAEIVAFTELGGDPAESLGAGIAAMNKTLAKAGLSLADMDRIEFMEAFAVTMARFLRDHVVDVNKVNVAGGHLARGHPLGASGAILLSTLLDNLEAADGRYGLVVASGATGAGAAVIVKRCV